MTFAEVEEMFNRAWRFSFSRKKWFFLFPVLLICGTLIVFCRAIALEASPWIVMSLSFLPVFLCTGVLLAAGVILIRMYYHEIKQTHFRFRKLLSQSLETLMGASYLSLPLILMYLLVWALMGVFHLLKALPLIGEAIGVLLSFGPFLLVFASLNLSILSLLLLFFATPHIALKSQVRMHMAEEVLERLQKSIFSNIVLLFIAAVPLLVTAAILTLSAVMTGVNYLTAKASLGISMQWFCIMVPFSLILTPFVIFFFNFATESYGLLQRRKRAQTDLEKVAEEPDCV